MPDRIVTLKIAKCGECPGCEQWWDKGLRIQCVPADRNMTIAERDTIPTWCPLLKEEPHE